MGEDRKRKLDRMLERVDALSSRGYSRVRILEAIGDTALAREAVEIAWCRRRAGDRFSRAGEMYFDEGGLRYSTPEEVSLFLAREIRDRAGSGVVLDAGCGIGGQLLGFASVLDKRGGSVVGVELDGRRVEYAGWNMEAYGLENVDIIHGDALAPGTFPPGG
ncbi:MAG: hypothetical protein J7L61_03640, partial [Thermoplasmata archaeon]|nr:hypothetical protein [Thermoplasmata archaeon]